ncbi:MAG: TrkH family potassium uptake protein [Desulfitobacteriaceae bacterium]|nr:TrkH family potassium uptake protein [Desulfitobacteriaceae bacterium]MDD4753122.1 TrkH family potassium uptake protein [Desulfitobacteriaceae bacterium]
MRFKLVFSSIGKILLIIGGCMLLPLLWSLYYYESDALPIIYAMLITLTVGGILNFFLKSKETIRQREGFAIVTLGWVFASIFGSLPYLLSGTFTSFTDAFFETMSGFTTTGSSVIPNIEALSHGILFWRCLTQWLGGMGIMVLFVALLSQIGGGGLQMFKAESPGGRLAEKLKPRMQESAKILWTTYVILSVVLVMLLLLGGMNFFDALCHSFGTMATGGLSTKNLSIGYYDSAFIEWVIIIFMFAAGTNLALYYLAISKRTNSFWRSEEFRLYLFIILGSTLFVFLNVMLKEPGGIEETFRTAAFQAVSMTTTTGFVTVDYNQWPAFSKIMLILLMFVGGCSGSTGGSIKVGRLLILLKHTTVEIFRLVHPRSVKYLKIGNKTIQDSLVINVMQFFFLYITAFFIGTAIMGALGLDIIEAMTSVISALCNVGYGLGDVGPTGNFAFIPPVGKWVLSFLMLLGRLEIFTVLALFLPEVWKHK